MGGAGVFGAVHGSIPIGAATWTFILVVLGVGAFDLCLNMFEGALSSTPVALNMLQHIYRELVTLGFISFMVFIVTNTGDLNHDELLAFEFAHMTLVFLGFSYILQAALVLTLTARIKRRFQLATNMTIADILSEFAEQGGISNKWFKQRWLPVSATRSAMEYKMYGKVFMMTYRLDQRRFDFGRYVIASLDDYVGHQLLHIDFKSWVMLLGLVFGNWVRHKLFPGSGGHYAIWLFFYSGLVMVTTTFVLLACSRLYELRLLDALGIKSVEEYEAFLVLLEAADLANHEVSDLDKQGTDPRSQDGAPYEAMDAETADRGRKWSVESEEGMVSMEDLRSLADRQKTMHGSHGFHNKLMDTARDMHVKMQKERLSSMAEKKRQTYHVMSSNGNIPTQSRELLSLGSRNELDPSSKHSDDVDEAQNDDEFGAALSAARQHVSGDDADTSEHATSSAAGGGPSAESSPDKPKVIYGVFAGKAKRPRRNATEQVRLADRFAAYSIRTSHDISQLFLFRSPSAYFFAVRVILLLNCFYMSLWITSYATVVKSYYAFMLILPFVCIVAMMPQVVKTSAMLNAMSMLKPDVVGRVVEETDDIYEAKETLRQRIMARLELYVGDDMVRGRAFVQRLFDEVDVDSSGSVTVDEFRFLLGELGLHFAEHRFRRLYRGLDLDGNKKLSVDELFRVLLPEESLRHDHLARVAGLRERKELLREYSARFLSNVESGPMSSMSRRAAKQIFDKSTQVFVNKVLSLSFPEERDAPQRLSSMQMSQNEHDLELGTAEGEEPADVEVDDAAEQGTSPHSKSPHRGSPRIGSNGSNNSAKVHPMPQGTAPTVSASDLRVQSTQNDDCLVEDDIDDTLED